MNNHSDKLTVEQKLDIEDKINELTEDIREKKTKKNNKTNNKDTLIKTDIFHFLI